MRQEVRHELDEKGIFNEIAVLFEQKANVLKKKSDTNEKSSTSKLSFLSRDLAQQFGINLHMFSNYTVEHLVEKVLECDDEILKNHSVLEFFNKDDFDSIPKSITKQFDPFSTNWKSADLPKQDVKSLQRADRIYLELFYNLRYYWKLRSMSLSTLLTYEKDYYDILYQLQKIDDGVQAIKNSERLKEFFFIVVEIGNYMNTKQTAGIKLSSLNKLAMVKTSGDKNTSFLHVVERIIREKYPDVYKFTQDLAKLNGLSKVTVDHVESEVTEYHDRIVMIKTSFEKGKLSHVEMHHPKDKFRFKIKSKLPSAIRKADLLKNQCKLTMEQFSQVMRYCGEDPSNAEAKNCFLKSFSDFLLLFTKVAQENKDKEAMDRVHQQRQQILQKASKEVEAEPLAKSKDTVDVLIRKLREVNAVSEKRSVPRPERDKNLLSRAMTLKSGIERL